MTYVAKGMHRAANPELGERKKPMKQKNYALALRSLGLVRPYDIKKVSYDPLRDWGGIPREIIFVQPVEGPSKLTPAIKRGVRTSPLTTITKKWYDRETFRIWTPPNASN